jgi:short-subunit dehydrogenase
MGKWQPVGKLAVVTGASSGIGRCLCLQLAANNCDVIAVARRLDRLQSLAAEVESLSADAGKLFPLPGDITDPQQRQEVKQRIDQCGGVLDLLVNNAGVGGIGTFSEASESRLRSIMEVNFFAAVELTRLLLPQLRQSRDPVICNIGSVLGHCGVPDKSEYCASKFALHGWTESLRTELARDGIQVTLVCPSTTRSEFFDSLVETAKDAKSKSLGSWSPERVAEATLDAIERRKREVVLSAAGKTLVAAKRLAPGLLLKLIKK